LAATAARPPAAPETVLPEALLALGATRVLPEAIFDISAPAAFGVFILQ